VHHHLRSCIKKLSLPQAPHPTQELPFEGRLSEDNRWVKMAQLIPWSKFESDAKNESTNQGKLIIDATCAPADISYPTDLGLLNKARIHTEKIIDILYKSLKVKINKKPRTYRKIARKDYLAVAKQPRPLRNKKIPALKK